MNRAPSKCKLAKVINKWKRTTTTTATKKKKNITEHTVNEIPIRRKEVKKNGKIMEFQW